MFILGLNVNHADTSAVILKDGKLLFGSEEERFTRIKHFTGFPLNSINYCLKEANISIKQIDRIAVNYKRTYNLQDKIKFSVKNLYKKNFFSKANIFLKKKSFLSDFKKIYNEDVENKVHYVPHHLAHICSTFYNFDIEEAAGYSFDGSGDFSTVESYHLKKNNLKIIDKTIYPNSLGIFYQAMTQFLGFKNYGDEYKVMGLASYGEAKYYDRLKKLFIFDNSHDFKLNLKYFNHQQSVIDYDFESGFPYFDDLFSLRLENLLGKSRQRNEKINQFHKDIAASTQKIFEDIALRKINYIQNVTKSKNLCLSGGCAFNSVFNGKIKELTEFKNIFVSANVGDAGGALGAALYISRKFKNKICFNNNPYIGTKYSNEYIKTNLINGLKKYNYIKYKIFDDRNELNKFVVSKIIEKKIVGWFQDRMEWGPRALGNRSILSDPRDPNMREIINLKIKKREEFRPFAPSILFDQVSDFFEFDEESNYMEKVCKVKIDKKNLIPAVVHIDQTSRLQTVKKETNFKFYSLIEEFMKQTKIPILLNTSLNVNEPICENPENAFEIFTKTSMDVLVIQDWVLTK